jgi:hypothetical protein
MDPAHLGFVRRDRPHGLVEIEVRPFGIAQLAGAHKHMRQQAQGGTVLA